MSFNYTGTAPILFRDTTLTRVNNLLQLNKVSPYTMYFILIIGVLIIGILYFFITIHKNEDISLSEQQIIEQEIS